MTNTEKKSPISLATAEKHRGVMRFDAFDLLYTEPRIALWELHERRKNPALKKSVREYLGSVSDILLKKFTQPRAILFRQVATPTHEILRFLRIAKQMKLKPLILEYHGDKFVSSGNRYKRSLGKMPIYQYTGSDGREMVEYQTICDFNTETGKAFSDIRCLNGEPLIVFHHKLFRELTKLNPHTHTVDATAWFKAIGEKAEGYYEHFLSLFIRDAILFENFVPFREEGAFTKSVIMPAFESLQARYGERPLIVRLLPEKDETRLFWDSYPRKAKKHLWM